MSLRIWIGGLYGDSPGEVVVELDSAGEPPPYAMIGGCHSDGRRAADMPSGPFADSMRGTSVRFGLDDQLAGTVAEVLEGTGIEITVAASHYVDSSQFTFRQVARFLTAAMKFGTLPAPEDVWTTWDSLVAADRGWPTRTRPPS